MFSLNKKNGKNLKFFSMTIFILFTVNTHTYWDFDPKRGYGELDYTPAYECYRFDTGKLCEESNQNNNSKLDISENIDEIMNKVLNGNEEILNQYSSDELKTIRNTIYAKKGYIFKNKDLKKYFSKKSWYKGYTSDENQISLSSDEKTFIDIVKSYE